MIGCSHVQSRRNLSHRNLYQQLRVFSMWLPVKSASILFEVLEHCDEVTSKPSLLQGEEISLLQSFLIRQVLQPFDHLCGSYPVCSDIF